MNQKFSKRNVLTTLEKKKTDLARTRLGNLGKIPRKTDKEMFLAFVKGMLQWRPEDRKTAKDLLEDPWLNDRI